MRWVASAAVPRALRPMTPTPTATAAAAPTAVSVLVLTPRSPHQASGDEPAEVRSGRAPAGRSEGMTAVMRRSRNGDDGGTGLRRAIRSIGPACRAGATDSGKVGHNGIANALMRGVAERRRDIG